jgi:hypothetical protein
MLCRVCVQILTFYVHLYLCKNCYAVYQNKVVFLSNVWLGKSVLAIHLIMFQELLFDLFLTKVSL